MRKELLVLAERYKENLSKLVKNGGYRSVPRARHYIEQHLAHLWRPRLDIDSDDDPLVDQLDFTPTMALVVHLFGKAVHHHGVERSKLPRLTKFMPVFDAHLEKVRFPHAVAKNDIARLIGKSRSAVDDAIGRLRGKSERYARLFDKRMAHPLFVETGIMLDMMTEPNLSFAFMFEDYEYAERVADDARLNDAETVHKQKLWSHEARESERVNSDERRYHAEQMALLVEPSVKSGAAAS